MAELLEIDAAHGWVLLVHDRLVCRDNKGELLCRFTATETTALVASAHKLLLDDDTYREHKLDGAVITLRGRSEGFERMLHLELANSGNQPALMLTASELVLLVDRLRINTGKAPAIEF